MRLCYLSLCRRSCWQSHSSMKSMGVWVSVEGGAVMQFNGVDGCAGAYRVVVQSHSSIVSMGVQACVGWWCGHAV